MFESPEELASKRRVRLLLIVGGMVLLVVVGASWYGWLALKPLPQIEECEALNWSAGRVDVSGYKVCYNDCLKNRIESCGSYMVVE